MSLHPDWIVPDWPAPAKVKAVVTTRAGGTSHGPYATFNLGLRTGDDPQTVATNRALLRRALPGDPKWLKQVHGTNVVEADELRQVPSADASIARRAGTVCAVTVADCVPVFLCDTIGTAVAVVHAGWRGLSRGLVETTVRDLRIEPGELIAYLGPGIGPRGFEVGPDVREAFLKHDRIAEAAFVQHVPGKWYADLFELVRQRLQRAGIASIHGGGMCTYSDTARFFSYRRDRTTGRMAALIWLSD
jgi:polyphenol oxidase